MAFDYTTLITSEHAEKPSFSAVVSALTGAVGSVTDALAAMPGQFDLDSAVGAQLDIIGLWVGFDRGLLVPIPNAWFSWDTAGLGWNQANWKGPFEPTEGIVLLDDFTYRVALRGKVASNYWDGTVKSLIEIASTELADYGIVILCEDGFNMSIDNLYIIGAGLTAPLAALLKRGIFPPKPAGVHINGFYVSSSPGAPFFGLDSDSAFVAGLGSGAWAVPL
jgi:hypothetical protein